MKHPTREEMKELIRQREATGRELERIRRDALRGLEYNWADVDALLEMGDYCPGLSRTTSGLVEMQRWFMKAALRNKLSGSLPRTSSSGE